MRIQGLLGLLALTVGLQASAWGQFFDSSSRGPKLGDSVVQYWQAGMIITAGAGPCQGLVGTAPLPVDWPEQEAKIIETDFSPKVKVSYRTVEERSSRWSWRSRSFSLGRSVGRSSRWR